MKYLLSALFLLSLPVFVHGQQNLVPNGSFEDTIGCPTSSSQVTAKCRHWRSYTNSTPDYMHACNSGFVSVPTNSLGSQAAAHGLAYCGFVAHATVPHFEYLATPITPLQSGVTYEVSMSVSRADIAGLASDNIGVFFYDSGDYTINTTQFLTLTPQVHYGNHGIIYDTASWVRLTQIFTADSAYDNIVIGGFNNAQSTYNVDTTKFPSQYSYYYIDSVVVKVKDSFKININDSLLCAGDTFSVFCSYYQSFNSNNVFTAQLSDALGSFSSPINIGQITSDTSGVITCVIPATISVGAGYRVRVVASSPADTSKNPGPIIKVGNPDSAYISISSNSPLCEGNALTLSASTNVTPTSYSWTGPSGFSSTLQNPVINGAGPANSGDYYSTLKFFGCEVKDTLSVVVKPLPSKPVANNNGPLCAGDSLHLNSTSSTNGVNYSWTGPGSFASAAQDTSVANSTTAMNGDYIVTADLNGCNQKDTTTVLVKPLPAAVTLSNNGPLCAGDTLHLSSTASSTGVSYSWSGPGSFSAGTQNAAIANATTAATGWYKMTVNLNGCVYKDSTNATVHPIPSMPNITFSNPLCVGETLNLGTGAIAGAVYSWSGPNNFSSSSQNPARTNMQFGDTGLYKLTTTVNGCTSPQNQAAIKINPVPFVVIFPSPSDSICQGDPANFTALPNNHGGTPTYQWYVNGQYKGTGTTFSSSTFNDQDIVHCNMTENTKCSVPYTDQSNDVTMHVLPWLAPSVAITANPNRPLNVDEYVTFTATATNGGNNPKYQWKRNGQDVQGATGAVWSANTLNDNDSISVELVSNYKCPQPASAVSNGIIVKVLTSVGGIKGVNGLTLYPNPNNGSFTLKGNVATATILSVEVTNALGQLVYSNDARTDNGILHEEVALPHAAAGVYMLKLICEDEITVMKFSVQ